MAPVQPSGVNPEPVMAPPREERLLGQRERAAVQSQQTRNRREAKRPVRAAAPLQTAPPNQEFPAKWVPTKEIIKHCPPHLLADLKKAASDAVTAQSIQHVPEAIRQAVGSGELPEKIIITPSRKRLPLTKVAGKVGGVNGIPRYVCVDSGANVGMIDEQAVRDAGLSSQIKPGKPAFSTANGKIAAGTGWIDTTIGLGTRL